MEETRDDHAGRSPATPTWVLRIGDTYRVPTAGLLEFLGLAPDESDRSPTGRRG